MELIINITANEAIDGGIWDKICEIKGINEFAVNEGLIDGNHKISLTKVEAEQLGLL